VYSLSPRGGEVSRETGWVAKAFRECLRHRRRSSQERIRDAREKGGRDRLGNGEASSGPIRVF